jgi:hypothetical protein
VAGRWNSDTLTNCYLTHLPRKFMRSMTSFSPSIQGNLYLPRAKTLPPQLLEQAVWPFVDEWLTWFDAYANGGDGDDDDHVKNESHIRVAKPRTRRTVKISPPRCFMSTKAVAYYPLARFGNYETRVPHPSDLDRSRF